MNVCIVDPYYARSHQYWAEFLQKNLDYQIQIFAGPPTLWKWQMEAGAIQLAQQVLRMKIIPDTFLITDYLNLPLFKSLLPSNFQNCRFVMYMHENQLTYPQSQEDSDLYNKRDNHYGWINYTSCLIADQIFFNSRYHFNSFYEALEDLSSKLPARIDVNILFSKSEILYLPFDIAHIQPLSKSKRKAKRIIWNHRWDYDKRPEVFLNAMIDLKKDGVEFELLLMGNFNQTSAATYRDKLDELSDQIIHLGHIKSSSEYLKMLATGDIIISTAIHDFFGISIVEGILSGCHPVLPFDLAYPELIPEELHSKVFYREDNSLKRFLKKTILNGFTEEDSIKCRRFLKSKIGWSTLEEAYKRAIRPPL